MWAIKKTRVIDSRLLWFSKHSNVIWNQCSEYINVIGNWGRESKWSTQVVNFFNHEVNGSFKCISSGRSIKLNLHDVWERVHIDDRVFILPALSTFISLVSRTFMSPSIKVIFFISIKWHVCTYISYTILMCMSYF